MGMMRASLPGTSLRMYWVSDTGIHVVFDSSMSNVTYYIYILLCYQLILLEICIVSTCLGLLTMEMTFIG